MCGGLDVTSPLKHCRDIADQCTEFCGVSVDFEPFGPTLRFVLGHFDWIKANTAVVGHY